MALFFGILLMGILLVPGISEVWADSTYVHSVGTDKNPARTLSYFANNGYQCPDGDDNCYFRSPVGLATDNSNNVYVTDYYDNHVVKFDSSGNFVLEFSTPANPYGIDVDSSGNIYVAIRSASSIYKYDSSGNFVSSFSTSGQPFWIEVDGSGNVYAVIYTSKLVQKYSSSGSLLYTLQNPESGNNQFTNPKGVAVDSSNNVYVSDDSGVQKFDSSGNFVSKPYTSYATYGSIHDPTCVGCYGPLGGIKITNSGDIVGVASVQTVNPGWGSVFFNNDPLEDCQANLGYMNHCGPILTDAIAIDSSGHVYVADSNNSRVVKALYTAPPLAPPPTPSGIISTDGLTLNANDGGDCSTVGTWDSSSKTCTLTADITMTGNENAIAIPYATGITLNGNGHTITGPGNDTHGNNGVYVSYSNDVTITGLIVQNFKNGIEVSQTTNSVIIEGNTVKDVFAEGIRVYHSSTLTGTFNIINNEVINAGINPGSARNAISLVGLVGNGQCSGIGSVLIKGNTITSGEGWGIQLDAENGCVTQNTISEKGSGIYVYGPGYSEGQSNNNIISNNVISFTGYGISIVGSGNTIDSNTVTSSIGRGFNFDSRSQNNIITNNVANNNNNYGFYFNDESKGHTFTGNTATGNGIADIEGFSTGPVGPFTISSSGGDCLTIGTWNQGTKTCTLNTDLSYTINIYDSGITLDGNSHTLDTGETPTGSGYGGVLNSGSGNTIKNLTVKGFTTGIIITGNTATVKNNILDGNYQGFQISPNNLGDGNNLFIENTVKNSLWHAFSMTNSNNNQVYNNNFISNAKQGNHVNGNNNIFHLDEPYGGNYYENEGHSSTNYSTYPLNSQQYGHGCDMERHLTWDGFCTSGAGFGSGSDFIVDDRAWTTMNGWVGFVPPLPETCFSAGGYSGIMLPNTGAKYQDPMGSFTMVDVEEQMVMFTGKLAPKTDGQCTLSDSIFLPGKTVTFTATKDGVTKTATIHGYNNNPVTTSVSDDGYGGFFHFLVPFSNAGDGGTWTYTYTFPGDSEYAEVSTTNTINIPEPPQKDETCFNRSGYSVAWLDAGGRDVDTSSRDVTFIGKLSPKQNGQCMTLNDAYFLPGKSVTVLAEKGTTIGAGGEQKSVTVTTGSDGSFTPTLSFSEDSDEGQWKIVFRFAGDEDYNPVDENYAPHFTITVPAPPENPIPIVTVPDDITAYSGTADFSFVADPINVNKYSGTTIYTYYPQPTVSMTGVGPVVVNYAVSASDKNSNGWASEFSGPTCDKSSGSMFDIGTTTVTCTATDTDGGVGTASFDVTVIANSITASPTCTPSSNSQLAVGSTIVSCEVTSANGVSTYSDSFTIKVTQKTPLTDAECKAADGGASDPNSVFVCQYPFDVTVEEGQDLVWIDTQPWQGFYRHSITSVDGLFDHSDTGKAGMLPSAWGGIGTYKFYDKLHPNAPSSMQGSITIAPRDTTSPTVNVPNTLTVSTEDANGTPTVTYSVTATDDRDVISGPSCNKQSGSSFPIGTTTVTCTASDAAGNTGTSSFNVKVEYTFVDETAPGFAPYDDISQSTTNPAGTTVSFTLPTATDNVAVTNGPTCDVDSGSMFNVGNTVVTCTASDAAGNTSSMSFNVVITQTFVDNTAPAITITPQTARSNLISDGVDSATVSAGSSAGGTFAFMVSAVDNIGVTVGPTCSSNGSMISLSYNAATNLHSSQPHSPGTLFPLGTSIISCTASDGTGNTGTALYIVNVMPSDTTPPVVSVPSNQELVTPNANEFPLFTWDVTAIDDVGISNVNTCNPDGPWYVNTIGGGDGTNPAHSIQFPVGTTTVTCTATDTSGNIGSASFTVTVAVTSELDCTSTFDDRDVEWLEACKPTLNASVYLNSTSPTGRTLDVKTSSDFYQGGVIFGCDGLGLPNCTSSDLIFSELSEGVSRSHNIGFNRGGDDYTFTSSNSWSVPLPEIVDAGTYTIPWTYSTSMQSGKPTI
ncbi:HYR domain-containing protein, partial [Candidatus Nitrosopelagicus sp.]|nr:HYR domain-containing protein [Candidatus Nitrosopelagicus sp.]